MYVKTSETVFVKNECFITPFLLTHTLNDLFVLQDDLGPLEPPPHRHTNNHQFNNHPMTISSLCTPRGG
jgi:hypothetical protein